MNMKYEAYFTNITCTLKYPSRPRNYERIIWFNSVFYFIFIDYN